jgi:hypothetical protein
MTSIFNKDKPYTGRQRIQFYKQKKKTKIYVLLENRNHVESNEYSFTNSQC